MFSLKNIFGLESARVQTFHLKFKHSSPIGIRNFIYPKLECITNVGIVNGFNKPDVEHVELDKKLTLIIKKANNAIPIRPKVFHKNLKENSPACTRLPSTQKRCKIRNSLYYKPCATANKLNLTPSCRVRNVRLKGILESRVHTVPFVNKSKIDAFKKSLEIRSICVDGSLIVFHDLKRINVANIYVCNEIQSPSFKKLSSPLAYFSLSELRSLFHRPKGPPFLEEGTPERILFELASSPIKISAIKSMTSLRSRKWHKAELRFYYKKICEILTGKDVVSGLWGEDATLDHVRLRLFADGKNLPHSPPVKWHLFFRWAGQHLDQIPLTRLPSNLIRATAVSLAATGSFKRAYDRLLKYEPNQRHESEYNDVMSILALRTTFEGEFDPAHLRFLLPRHESKKNVARRRTAWDCALIALHALRVQNHVSGVVHLINNMVCADLRNKVWALARRKNVTLPELFGFPPKSSSEREALFAQLVFLLKEECRSRMWRSTKSPWPQEWGGPDFTAFEHAIQNFLKCPTWVVRSLLLDDNLAASTIWGLAGRIPTASLRLASAARSRVMEEPRGYLQDALNRERKNVDVIYRLDAHLFRRPDPSIELLFKELSTNFEPNVALGSPYWKIGNDRGPVTAHLIREKRMDVARTARNILDRPDICGQLRPYWLMWDEPMNSRALVHLATWISGFIEEPSKHDFLMWMEKQCREITNSFQR